MLPAGGAGWCTRNGVRVQAAVVLVDGSTRAQLDQNAGHERLCVHHAGFRAAEAAVGPGD